jgi:hypothetical protein
VAVEVDDDAAGKDRRSRGWCSAPAVPSPPAGSWGRPGPGGYPGWRPRTKPPTERTPPAPAPSRKIAGRCSRTSVPLSEEGSTTRPHGSPLCPAPPFDPLLKKRRPPGPDPDFPVAYVPTLRQPGRLAPREPRRLCAPASPRVCPFEAWPHFTPPWGDRTHIGRARHFGLSLPPRCCSLPQPIPTGFQVPGSGEQRQVGGQQLPAPLGTREAADGQEGAEGDGVLAPLAPRGQQG